MFDNSRIPSRLIVIAGTYDGVLAGWDTVEHAREADKNDVELKLLRRNDGRYLKLSFAMAAHEGSVRCIDIAGAAPAADGLKQGDNSGKPEDAKEGRKRQRSGSITESPAPPSSYNQPGTLLSGGYDETINIFNLQKHAQVGDLKTPNDLGSPLCCSFAPPSCCSSPLLAAASASPTHVLVGLTSGKIILYKKRDWSVQHVLSGHDDGGVQCLAVHPTGKMALSGGRDGKVILWDLMKGRLAFVHKLPHSKIRGRKENVNHIIWSDDGSRYAYCYGTKITARDVASGEDLLDVDMPSRVNQLAFVGGPEGMFVAAACDDGGLPVLEVGQLEEEEDANTRRAIMAIEPVDDKVVAGDDRFKCIRSVEGGSGFLVVTANSGGVVSLMDLEGAARMMLTGNDDEDGEDGSSDDEEADSDSDEEVEAAVEILDSVRIGSGARITDLAVWSYGGGDEGDALTDDNSQENDSDSEPPSSIDDNEEEDEGEGDRNTTAKKKREGKNNKYVTKDNIELDPEAIERARKLVVQAKKHQMHQKKKKKKLANHR